MHGTEAGALLLDADPDLGAALTPEEFATARRRLRARVLVLEKGPGNGFGDAETAGHLGLLVLEGVLVRDISVRGRGCAELLGAGDVLRPWDEDEALDASVGQAYRWEVLQRARVAVLDARVGEAMTRWPSMASVLLQRSLRRVRTIGFQYALTQVPGVDVRLHLVLWHLADRWGRMTPDGVVLHLPLTHRTLGRLIGARRPSVTSSLQRLDREGLVGRMPDGAWLLRGTPAEVELQHEPRRRRASLAAVA